MDLWREAKDDGGNTYYWNTETKETRWTPPDVPSYSLTHGRRPSVVQPRGTQEGNVALGRDAQKRVKAKGPKRSRGLSVYQPPLVGEALGFDVNKASRGLSVYTPPNGSGLGLTPASTPARGTNSGGGGGGGGQAPPRRAALEGGGMHRTPSAGAGRAPAVLGVKGVKGQDARHGGVDKWGGQHSGGGRGLNRTYGSTHPILPPSCPSLSPVSFKNVPLPNPPLAPSPPLPKLAAPCPTFSFPSHTLTPHATHTRAPDPCCRPLRVCF